MLENLGKRVTLANALTPASLYLKRPFKLLKGYNREDIQPDLIAGLTVAVILLPQAIAFATIANLPPQMGLYSAIIGAIFAALWGSSGQIHNGPANAISLLVFSSLQNSNITDPTQIMIAAGLLAIMAGIFQLVMGLAQLGLLINFVSHSVIVGFSTGAGVLIAINQTGPLLGVSFSSPNLFETFFGIISNISSTHLATALLGFGTTVLIVILQKINPKLPGALISMIVASIIVFAAKLDIAGVSVIGQLPSGFPPLVDVRVFNVDLVGHLSTGALAIGAIGLVQTMAIAKSISTQTGQKLNSNQEFVSQGIANIAAGLFSGYACAASFSRSAVNYQAGAKTPMSSIISSIVVLFAMLALGSFAAYLPRTALAAVLIVISYNMIDREEITRIWRGARGDAIIMLVTFLGTLFLAIEFAVLLGILFSFARYIMRTSAPRVHPVVPSESYDHFAYQPEKAQCPQLGIIDILGDLYFGAVNHVEEAIMEYAEKHPEQRFLLIRLNHVNLCDFSGIHMLEGVVRYYRDKGGDVFLVRAGFSVRRVMETTGFDKHLHEDHFLADDDAISHIFYRVLDPAVCIYECPVKVFKECQNLPKRNELVDIPHEHEIPDGTVVEIESKNLWELMYDGEERKPPYIVDVREPREYNRGHIPDANSIPLPQVLKDSVTLPNDRQVVLVCRSGRRSRRAAYALHKIGVMDVVMLKGGMLAWEAAGLLEAIE